MFMPAMALEVLLELATDAAVEAVLSALAQPASSSASRAIGTAEPSPLSPARRHALTLATGRARTARRRAVRTQVPRWDRSRRPGRSRLSPVRGPSRPGSGQSRRSGTCGDASSPRPRSRSRPTRPPTARSGGCRMRNICAPSGSVRHLHGSRAYAAVGWRYSLSSRWDSFAHVRRWHTQSVAARRRRRSRTRARSAADGPQTPPGAAALLRTTSTPPAGGQRWTSSAPKIPPLGPATGHLPAYGASSRLRCSFTRAAASPTRWASSRSCAAS